MNDDATAADRPGFAVLDCETTGFSVHDRILEIGLVLLDADGAEEGRWETLVQPRRDVGPTDVHGITAADVAMAPEFAEIAGTFSGLIGGRIVVAHNAAFERRFLVMEFAAMGIELPDDAWTIDTIPVARRLLPTRSGKLADCLEAAGLVNDRPHAALGDAAATANLFRTLLPALGPLVADRVPLVFEPRWLRRGLERSGATPRPPLTREEAQALARDPETRAAQPTAGRAADDAAEVNERPLAQVVEARDDGVDQREVQLDALAVVAGWLRDVGSWPERGAGAPADVDDALHVLENTGFRPGARPAE